MKGTNRATYEHGEIFEVGDTLLAERERKEVVMMVLTKLSPTEDFP